MVAERKNGSISGYFKIWDQHSCMLMEKIQQKGENQKYVIAIKQCPWKHAMAKYLSIGTERVSDMHIAS